MSPYLLLFISSLSIFLEFFLPGGVLGLVGVIAFLLSLFYSLLITPFSAVGFSIYLILSIFTLTATIQFALYCVKVYGKGTLYEESTLTKEENGNDKLLHKVGKTLSPCYPSGYVEIEGRRYSAISRHRSMEANEKVVVVGVEGNNLWIEQIGDKI